MPLENIKRKRIADYLLLAFTPAMLIASLLIQLIIGEAGLLELYGYNALVVEGLIILIPSIIVILRNGGFASFAFKRISLVELLLSLALGIGLFFFTTGINSVTSAILYFSDLPVSATEIPSGTASTALFSMLYLAVAPAIAEETLFRGAIMRSWLPINAKAAVFHTSMLFALMHFQLTALPALFFVGYMFSYISYLSGSVYTSIAMHFSYNASGVVLTSLLYRYTNTAQMDANEALDQISNAIDAGGASNALVLATIIAAAAFYFAIGFLIGHPSYRALLRSSAKRKNLYAAEFRDLKVRLAQSETFELAGLESGEGQENITNEPVEAPKKIVNWRVVCSYVFMVLVGVGVLVFEIML